MGTINYFTARTNEWNGSCPDGSIYTVGSTPGTISFGVFAVVTKYNQAGTIIWKKNLLRTTREELYDVKIFANDEIIYIGTIRRLILIIG